MRWLWRHYGDDPNEADELERQIAQQVASMVERSGTDPEQVADLLLAHAACLAALDPGLC
jgi:hypothetical protein